MQPHASTTWERSSIGAPRLVALLMALLAWALVTGGCHANGGGARVAPEPPMAEAGGSAGGTQEGGEEVGDEEDTAEVVGTLTDEGVECRALRGEDGELYTLSGGARGFETGDRVRVRGTVARMSICMQGTTIAVEEIEAAPEG